MAATSQPSRSTPVPSPLSSTPNSHTTQERTADRPRSSANSLLEPPADGAIGSLGASRQEPQTTTTTTTTSSSGFPPTSPKPGGLFAFAAAAIDKTLAGISEPRVRPRQSLSRLSIGPDSNLSNGQRSPSKVPRNRTSSSAFTSPSALPGDGKLPAPTLLRDPPSQPYSETDPTRPPPILLPRVDSKMHQTSSRLLRMTDDDRPFTKVRWIALHTPAGTSLVRGGNGGKGPWAGNTGRDCFNTGAH